MDLTNYNDKLTSELKRLEEKYKNQRWFAREYLNKTINEISGAEFRPEYDEFPRTAILQFIRYNENDWLEVEEDKNGKIKCYLCKECEIGTYKCIQDKEKSKYYVKILIVPSDKCVDLYNHDERTFININENTEVIHFDYLGKSIKNANIDDKFLEVMTADKAGFINTVKPTCFKNSSNNYVLKVTYLARVNDTNIEIFVSHGSKKCFSLVDKRDIEGRFLGEKELLEFLNTNNIQCAFNNKKLKEQHETIPNTIEKTIEKTTYTYNKPKEKPRKKSKLKLVIVLAAIAYVIYKFVLK